MWLFIATMVFMVLEAVDAWCWCKDLMGTVDAFFIGVIVFIVWFMLLSLAQAIEDKEYPGV